MKRTKKLDFDVTLDLFGADPFRDRQSGSGNMALIKEALHEMIRDRLTDRQRQVILMHMQGMREIDIAESLASIRLPFAGR